MDLDAIGVGLGAAAGVVAALKLFTSFAPFQFVWKRLIHDPVQEGLRGVVRDEVSPLLDALRAETLPNGGSSLRDAVDRLEKGQAEIRQDLEAGILAVQGRLVN